MTTDELARAERHDLCIGIAHDVRNRLSCAHGTLEDTIRGLTRLQRDLHSTMSSLQERMDEARAQVHLIDPAGTFEVRRDAMGDGAFGASRRNGGRQYAHRGLDTIVTPGESARSPMTGVVEREGLCYAGEEYKLLVIVSWPWEAKVLYVEPLEGIVGRRVRQGEIIGHAQDVSLRDGYAAGGMLPHLHTEVLRVEELVDPAPLMGLT